jgi:acyl-CoA thioester hydrolase
MANTEFTFFHPLRVRWAEVDMQSVVFNGHYLTYFDVALTEYWRAVKLPSPLLQATEGVELFVKKATLEYHASAKFDDDLQIGVKARRVGKTSLTILLKIYRNKELLVSGEMIYVYVNTREGKSTPIPNDWIQMLTKYETASALIKN